STVSGPSTSTPIEFIAVLDGVGAETVNLQADRVSISTNGDTSTLTAVVRDENSNFVKNATVNFSLVDVSGGSITPLTATTDSLGRATTIYTSSAASSATDGVSITATEASQSLTSTETLTVADQQLFITLGTSHLLQSPSDAWLTREFGVFVTDAFGNAATNVSIQIGLKPLQPGPGNLPGDDTNSDTKAYRKGYWEVVDIAGTDTWVQNVQAYCNTEDADLDGILDLPGEDTNNDGILWPGNTALVPSTVVTDSNGYGTFNVTYLKNFAYWSSVEVSASASVSGTESIAKHKMVLIGLAADYADADSGVPGQLSPFGIQNACANPG
ncbi:MAG: Ig-like domain-containing protein, partial [Gammaproteobacteria bacterium]|nr:Ig-like domain-containing protein [Gammaproteobacteria bacterium]